MIQTIVVDAVAVREELAQLIVAVSSVSIILNLEVGVAEQRKGCTVARLELQLVRQDSDDFLIFLVADQLVDGLSVLTVGHRLKLVVHLNRFSKFIFEFK